MNYEPNTKQWKVGEMVLHDADHKSAEMLMCVIGYTPEGLCKTKYISKNYHCSSHTKDASTMKQVWVNRLAVLHDPTRFGIAAQQNVAADAPRA